MKKKDTQHPTYSLSSCSTSNSSVFLPFLVLLLFFWTFVGSAQGRTALLIIDVQRSFAANGSFPMAGGSLVVQKINDIRSAGLIDVVVVGTIQNCANEISFASTQPGVPVFTQQTFYFSSTDTPCALSNSSSSYPPCTDISAILQQTLYPDYTIIDTPDAQLDPDLLLQPTDLFLPRNASCDVPFYSLFKDNLGTQSTQLDTLLKTNGVDSVFLCGYSYDTSLYYTAKDAKKLGYNVYVIQDASKAFLLSAVSMVNADLSRHEINVIDSVAIYSVVQLIQSKVVKKSLPPYQYLDPLTTWSGASSYCYPNQLCSAADYCSNSTPNYDYLSIGTWAPISDGPNQWLYLAYSPSTGSSLTTTPCTPLTLSPSVLQSPLGIPVLCCTPNPTPPITPVNPRPPRGEHQNEQPIDTQPQVTRIALIACLCLGLGVTSGLAIGCFAGRKSVESIPKIM